MDIKDVANEVGHEICIDTDSIIFAHQKGNNVLILCKIDPLIRFDRKKACYRLEHRWLSNPASVHNVQGNDFTYWTTKEITPWLKTMNKDATKSLFDFVDLFG